MSLSSKLDVSFAGKLSSVIDLGVSEASLSTYMSASLADGTGAGQANRLWCDSITLAASATQDIDLAGSLLDAIGGPAVFARVKGLFVAADAANTNNVIVGAAATNPFVGLLGATHTVTLRPGAVFAVFAGVADATGYPVVATTGDLLRVANSAAGSTVSLNIAVIGCSA